MKESFKAVKITDTVYWVGAIDWTLQDFHGYLTKRGTTYNAYLIMDEKITLIDTVKLKYKNELIARISSVVDPGNIDYIISNHSEMDHSGCLPEIIKLIKPEKVFASKMGVKTLAAHFPGNTDIAEISAVDDLGTLNLGKLTLKFIETKMLHWPDSMFTYIEEEKFLFSQDAFGMHLATNHMFADEVDEGIVYYEAGKYYANILLPYSDRILKLLEQVTEMKLEINYIATDHGPIWRKDFDKVFGWYSKWAVQKPEKRAVIVFDTMWGSTEMMARAVSEGIKSEGISSKVLHLAGNHRSDIAKEILCAGAFIAGSPTINNKMFPTMADLFCYLGGLRPKNLIGFAFGSYGWSGESIKHLEEELKDMDVEITGPGIKAKYVPDDEILKECFNRGVEIAKRLKAH